MPVAGSISRLLTQTVQTPVFSAHVRQLVGQALQAKFEVEPYYPTGQEHTLEPELYVAPV
jgi:hypothetical protein